MKTLLSFCLILFAMTSTITGQDIQLPNPNMQGGKPLMEALSLRKSHRYYDTKNLTNQQLSDLMWAAWGINRPENGRRTAPSSHNCQDIELYVAMASGVYVYNAEKHSLEQIGKEDIRKSTGVQDFVEKAPLNFIFVSDFNKIHRETETDKFLVAGLDAGYISQNIYLFCASEDLKSVARAMYDEKLLRSLLQLPEHKKIVLTQTVGFPAPKE